MPGTVEPEERPAPPDPLWQNGAALDGSMPPSPLHRCRPRLSLLLCGALLFLIAETTPHLVHHLFETDQEPECEVLVIADHTPAATAPLALFVVALSTSGRTDPAPASRPALAPARRPASRGPPTASLAWL
jgi:hypothetical protein